MNNSEIFMVSEHRGPKKMNDKKLFIVPGQYGLKKMNNRKIFTFSAPSGKQFNVGYALELIRRQEDDC